MIWNLQDARHAVRVGAAEPHARFFHPARVVRVQAVGAVERLGGLGRLIEPGGKGSGPDANGLLLPGGRAGERGADEFAGFGLEPGVSGTGNSPDVARKLHQHVPWVPQN